MKTHSECALSFDCMGDQAIGILHSPENQNRVGILFVVGGPQYRVGSHRQFVIMARHFAAAGYACFRFDYRGMGDNAGKSRDFESVEDDINAAMSTLLREAPEIQSIILLGLCDGASAILMSASSFSHYAGAILINPWVRTEVSEVEARVRHYYISRLAQLGFWKKLVSGNVDLSNSIRQYFAAIGQVVKNRFDAARRQDETPSYVDTMLGGFLNSSKPALILTSENDLTAAEFLDLTRQNTKWRGAIARPIVQHMHISGADHTFSNRASLDRATNCCIEWLRLRF